MQNKFFLSTVMVIFLGFTWIAAANSIDGTVKGTIFEAKKGEKLLAQQGNMGVKGDELVSVEILVYGVSCEQEPANWKKDPIFAYGDVVIQNPGAVSINSRVILSAIGMAHYKTFDGKWQGNRVTRILIR